MEVQLVGVVDDGSDGAGDDSVGQAVCVGSNAGAASEGDGVAGDGVGDDSNDGEVV